MILADHPSYFPKSFIIRKWFYDSFYGETIVQKAVNYCRKHPVVSSDRTLKPETLALTFPSIIREAIAAPAITIFRIMAII